MQRAWKGVALALLTTMCLAGSASAQSRMGGGRGMLLRMQEVQAELKLTDEQKTKLGEMLSRPRGDRQGRGSGFQDLSPEERQKQLAERRANEEKQLREVLNADQIKRYRQLQLQQQGLSALRNTPIQAELKLTEDQRSKVAGILREQSEEMRTLRQDSSEGRRGRGGASPQRAALRKKTEEKLDGLLTEDQRKQWKEMLGSPFTFPAPRLRGRTDSV